MFRRKSVGLSSVTDLSAAKKQLRQEMRQKRQALSSQEKAELDSAMFHRLIQSPIYQDCQQLFCFVSLAGEPDTFGLIAHALQQGKEVAVPRCLPHHQMAFHRLAGGDNWQSQLESGTYGVLEPKPTLPQLIPDETKRTLCLVPGLAFDRKGGRLGYGAGYYDRFLQAYPHMKKLGFGATAFVIEEVPMEQTDQRLDGLVSEDPLEVWNG